MERGEGGAGEGAAPVRLANPPPVTDAKVLAGFLLVPWPLDAAAAAVANEAGSTDACAWDCLLL